MSGGGGRVHFYLVSSWILYNNGTRDNYFNQIQFKEKKTANNVKDIFYMHFIGMGR